MNSQKDLLMDSSILYRSTQKYYDRMLQDLNLTYAQLPILIMIYEQEGISSQQIAKEGGYDKGTITKNVQKLESLGYVQVQSSLKDKRAKELYTTDKTKEIISRIYRIRSDWWKHIIKDIPKDQIDHFTSLYQLMVQGARNYVDKDTDDIQFFAHQKVSLCSYPDKISTVLFTGGCNFRCPYCNQADLVFLKENQLELSLDAIYEYLNKRKHVLQAVTIDGGEPLMHPQLEAFLKVVKSLGYLVKVQTNGSYYDRLVDLVEKKLIDFVGMDIKNAPSQYAQTIGMKDYKMDDIEKSKNYLLENHVDYCFVTTLVKEFHSPENIVECAKWIQGAKSYVLRTFQTNSSMIQDGLHGFTNDEMNEMKNLVRPYVQQVTVES